MKRTCGSCRKCCDGTLSGEVFGHKFYPGKPCHFVSITEGCIIYEKRPEDPCKNFECWWKLDDSIPLEFQPNLIKFMGYKRMFNNFEYFFIHDVDDGYSVESLEWYKDYALKQNVNLVWKIDREGIQGIQGSNEFCNAFKSGSSSVG